MDYESYQHIEKIGNGEVEGILSGTVCLFYKIDGTNSCIWLKDDGTLGFGSRNRELSLEGRDADNGGFMLTMTTEPSHAEEMREIAAFLHRRPDCIIYGEWLIPHTLRRYEDSAWKKFYVFDVLDSDTGRWVSYDEYSAIFDGEYPHIHYIPLMAKLTNPTQKDIEGYLQKTGDWLIKPETGLGEGIVIKNYDFVNPYGRRTWAKMLTEDFLNTRKETRQANREAKDDGMATERKIISMLTQEQVLKEKMKIMEANGGIWQDRFVGELLGRVWHEFWHDNWEEIVFRKAKGATVNLKALNGLSNDFVKKVIGI